MGRSRSGKEESIATRQVFWHSLVFGMRSRTLLPREGVNVLRKRWTGVFATGVLVAAINISNGQNTEPPSADSPATDEKPAPRLELSQREWNFGRVWSGDPCQTEVELRNTGNATLRIINVKSSCGCAVAKPKRSELAPGEADAMVVTYDTRKNQKKVSHTITIETNDPVEPQIRFGVRGEVWHVFDAKPYPVIGFGLIRPESEKTESIELHNNLAEKVFPQLRPLSPRLPFDIKLEEIEAGMTYRLLARTKPLLKLGSNLATVVLETGVERLPTMSIKVTAVALERVSARPDRLRIVPVHSQRSTRHVSVNYPEDQPIEITEIKASHPSIKVQKLPGRQAPTSKSEFAAQRIRITLPPFAEFPEEGARVEIYTNDPDPKFQKFVVPIEKIYPGKSPAKRASPKPK